MRSAVGPGGHGRLRGAGAGRAVSLQARRCRSCLYSIGHHRRHGTGCQALPGLALRPAVDRCRHRRSAALATRRMAHRRTHRRTRNRNSQPQQEVEGPGAISLLILEPIEAIGAGHIQYGLWGSDGQDDQRAGWAFARVQGLLGPESVLAPVLAGGRSAVDRITLVPWGDEKVSPTSPGDPWPGSLPAPSPTRVAAVPGDLPRPRQPEVVRGPRRRRPAGSAHRPGPADRLSRLARPAGRARRTAPAGRRLGRALAAGRTVVVDEQAARRSAGADRHRGRGRDVAATGHRRLAGRGGVRLMGWNNPNVPWSELERALSGRPPRPGTGPIGPLRPLGHDRPDTPEAPLEYPSSQRRERPRMDGVAPSSTATRVPYAELHAHSAFSFLDGASTPEHLVAEALRLGLDALAITDHDGLYGIVRFAEAAADTSLRTLYGAELSLGLSEPQMGVADPVGDHLLVLARGQEGYNRLSVQISRAQLDGGEKGRPLYDLDALANAAQDQWLILTGCRKGRVRRALLRAWSGRRRRRDPQPDGPVRQVQRGGRAQHAIAPHRRRGQRRACPDRPGVGRTRGRHHRRALRGSPIQQARRGDGSGPRPPQSGRGGRLPATGAGRAPAVGCGDGGVVRQVPLCGAECGRHRCGMLVRSASGGTQPAALRRPGGT